MYDYLSQSKKVLEPKDFRRIHKKCESAVDELKTCESRLIYALQEADQFKVYRYIGLNSLFQYGLSLGLSESQAYNYITVARKSIECPELQKAIDKKEITISKARVVSGVMRKDNQIKWVQLARTSTKRELEREVAKISPRALKKESVRFVNDFTLELQLPVTEQVFKQLERVKDLLSQKLRRNVTLEQALDHLSTDYISRNDPIEKARRWTVGEKRGCKTKIDKSTELEKRRVETKYKQKIVTRSVVADSHIKNNEATSLERLSPSESRPVPRQVKRKKLPATIIHKINLRDQGLCQFRLSSKKICSQSRWIEIHHIRPVHLGGGDDLGNLVTLCREHHKQVHLKDLK